MTTEVLNRYRNDENAVRAAFAHITLAQLLNTLSLESMGKPLYTKTRNRLIEAFRKNPISSREPLKSVADLAATRDEDLQIYRHITSSSMLVHIDTALIKLVSRK